MSAVTAAIGKTAFALLQGTCSISRGTLHYALQHWRSIR
jgi:hypothetical protein